MEVIEDIWTDAHARGIKVHLDGARIFNAGLPPESPGSRPCRASGHGDVLPVERPGRASGIHAGGDGGGYRSRPGYRKRLGGAMRQSGVLAAAGLIALEEMPHRLGEDHANAGFLAAELAKLPGIQIDPSRVQTNIVIFDVSATGLATTDLTAALKARGILMNGINPRQMRAVTHFDVSRQQCATAAAAISETLGAKN